MDHTLLSDPERDGWRWRVRDDEHGQWLCEERLAGFGWHLHRRLLMPDPAAPQQFRDAIAGASTRAQEVVIGGQAYLLAREGSTLVLSQEQPRPATLRVPQAVWRRFFGPFAPEIQLLASAQHHRSLACALSARRAETALS